MRNYEVIKFCLYALSLLFASTTLVAQDTSKTVTKNFKFVDGVYLSFEDFQKDKPNYSWDEIHANIFVNPQTFITQVISLERKLTDGLAPMNLDSIWGFTIAGIPYVKLPKGAMNKSFPVYAGLRVRGKICYFYYEEEVEKKILISAYNPLTGQPFRQGNVNRTEILFKEWMLHFETGERIPFNADTFRQWIKDDTDLLRSMVLLTPEELEERLFKCLLIYDDRHLVKIK